MAMDIVQRLRCVLKGNQDAQRAADEIVKLRAALEFYRDEALALSINLAGKKSDAVMASVTVLSLDAGKRAIDALVRQQGESMDTKDLVGKTISEATMMKREGFDDKGWLRLKFTDGTACVIVAGYGGYTGESEGEYPTFIGVSDDIADLVPNTEVTGRR